MLWDQQKPTLKQRRPQRKLIRYNYLFTPTGALDFCDLTFLLVKLSSHPLDGVVSYLKITVLSGTPVDDNGDLISLGTRRGIEQVGGETLSWGTAEAASGDVGLFTPGVIHMRKSIRFMHVTIRRCVSFDQMCYMIEGTQ